MRLSDPSKQERRGMIMFVVILLILLLVGAVLFWPSSSGKEVLADKDSLNYQSLRDSLLQDSLRRLRHKGKSGSRYYAVPENRVETFAFDPNTADSTALLRLGFPPYMVRNIYKYRARGGRYHTPDDVKRVYGMTGELWERIAPYIRIDKKYQYLDASNAGSKSQKSASDSTRHYPQKLQEGMKVNINSADTTELQKIPGIGHYYASQIVKYRDQLGGFVSLSQLDEIETLPEDFSRWFHLDAVQIRQIDVNHATWKELIRHPYIQPRLAKPIQDHIRKYGKFRSIQELRRLPGCTDEDIKRLTPYLIIK